MDLNLGPTLKEVFMARPEHILVPAANSTRRSKRPSRWTRSSVRRPTSRKTSGHSWSSAKQSGRVWSTRR